MHPEIDKLIEMALTDGQVTDKEREIILRKAEKLGLDVDEVEMVIEGKLNSPNTILVKNTIPEKDDISSVRNYIPRKAIHVEFSPLNKENEIKLRIAKLQMIEMIFIHKLKNVFLVVNKDFDEITSYKQELYLISDNLNKKLKLLNDEVTRKIVDKINLSISDNFGKTSLIIDNPTRLIGLNTQEMSKLISNEGTWDVSLLNRKRMKYKLYSILGIIGSVIIMYSEVVEYSTDLISFQSILILVLFICIGYLGYVNKQLKEQVMNFNSNDIEIVISEVLKNFNNEIDTIRKIKDEINKLEKILKKIESKSISQYNFLHIK